MSEPSPTPRRRRPLVLGVAALLVTALPVGGFVAYGAYTRSGEIVYDRGGETFGADAPPLPVDAPQHLPAAVPSATPEAIAGAVATDAPSTPTPVASGGATGPAAGRSGSGAPAPAGTRAAGRSAGRLATARTTPIPGTYPLTVDGTEKVTFGPFSFCGRDLPTSTSLVVAPAANEPVGSYNFDVRYFPGDAGKHDERHIYRYSSGGVDLAFESATVTCSGVRQGSDISYTPVQRCIVGPLEVGSSWSGKGGDADRTENYTSTVTGTDTVAIAGHRVPVFVIDTRSTFTGSESGERSRRWWYAPSLAMPVKWTDTTSGGRSGAKYSNEITVTVAGLPDAAAAVLGAAGR